MYLMTAKHIAGHYQHSMVKLPDSRAFVVLFSDETDPTAQHPSGRVEHADSGLRGRFSSREELWAFIERVLTKEQELKQEEPEP